MKGDDRMDDLQIITLYNQRNEKAIRETADKYGEYCFTVANNILFSREDSEECVNDTWLRAWNVIPPQFPDCLKLFLAKITRNLAFDRFKAMQRKKRGGAWLTQALEEIEEFLPSAERAETPAEEAEFMRTVNRFLRMISERDCNIFINRYFHAEAPKTIAKKYGITEAHVRKILSRTRSKLKIFLISEGYPV